VTLRRLAQLVAASIILLFPALDAAGGGLLDANAIRNRLIAEAVRLTERYAPPRSEKPPPWAQRSDPPLATIAVLADPHCDDTARAAWTKPSRERLLKVIRHLNDAVKPQAVLLLGDIVAFGDAEQLRRVKALLSAHLNAPCHAAAGNHDGPGYETVFGTSNYSIAIGGVRFIAIAHRIIQWDTGWGVYDRLDWLAAELAAHRGEPTIVFAHVPIVFPAFANNAAVLQLLDAQPQVLGYVAGHMHVDYDMRLAKVHLGMPMLARPPHAFKVVRVYPDAILIFTHEDADGAYRQANIYQKIDIPPAFHPKAK